MLKQISRREFLRSVGLVSVGTMALAGCQMPVAVQPSPQRGDAGVPAAPRSVEVWDYDPTGTDLWVAADENFGAYFAETYPDIEVNRTVAPWSGFTEKFLTSVAGGAKYDVIYGWVRWLPQFIENSTVVPLESYLDNDPDVNADDFYEGAKEFQDGNLYGLAWYIGPNLIYYNKSRVAEAGVPDPKQLDVNGDWDYEAWHSFATAMSSERDGAPIYGFDGTFSRYPGDINAMLKNHGSALWNADFTESQLDSAASVALWQFIQRLYVENLTPPPGAGDELAWPNGFNTERSMAMVSGPNYVRLAVQDSVPDKFDIGQVRMPAGPEGQEMVVYLNSYYMGASGNNPDDGWIWYKERSFSEAAAELYLPIGAGRFSVRKSIAPATEYEWEDEEVYTSISPVMRTYEVSPKESEFEPLFQAMRDEILLGQRPLDEILEQYADEATQLLSS